MKILNQINVSVSQWAVPRLPFNNSFVPEFLAEEPLLRPTYLTGLNKSLLPQHLGVGKNCQIYSKDIALFWIAC